MQRFKKGDSVTLSANPTIQLAEYQFLKPMASITIVVGDDPEVDITNAEVALREALYRSVLVDLGVRSELQQFIADTPNLTEEALAQKCLEAINGNRSSKENRSQVPAKKTVIRRQPV